MFLTGTKKMLGDRIFLQKAVRIALPVAMQGMLNTIVNPVSYTHLTLPTIRLV